VVTDSVTTSESVNAWKNGKHLTRTLCLHSGDIRSWCRCPVLVCHHRTPWNSFTRLGWPVQSWMEVFIGLFLLRVVPSTV